MVLPVVRIGLAVLDCLDNAIIRIWKFKLIKKVCRIEEIWRYFEAPETFCNQSKSS